jgi:hypothetical protein
MINCHEGLETDPRPAVMSSTDSLAAIRSGACARACAPELMLKSSNYGYRIAPTRTTWHLSRAMTYAARVLFQKIPLKAFDAGCRASDDTPLRDWRGRFHLRNPTPPRLSVESAKSIAKMLLTTPR